MARPSSRLLTRRGSNNYRNNPRIRCATLIIAIGICSAVLYAFNVLNRHSNIKEETLSIEIVDKYSPPLRNEITNVNPAGNKTVLECKSWEETDLLPNRQLSDIIYDRAMPPIERLKGVKWRLTISDDAQADWLGIHNLDRKYTYGSKEADRRFAENGYCKVHMPSIPRAGSSWFRTMFEVATGRPSTSVWPEGGEQDPLRRYYFSHDPCGASPDQFEGSKEGHKPHVCRNLTLPLPSDPVLMKSHTPFYPSFDRPALDPRATCAILLIVRNPLDTHDAWRRYSGKDAKNLRDFLPMWSGHLNHWIAEADNIPIIVFRYEDLLMRADEVLEMVLSSLGPGWSWSKETIDAALQFYGPRESFSQKCGKSILKYTKAEVEMVRLQYRGLLEHFGYNFEMYT